VNFNKHLEIKGAHALFSPSQSSWLRYDDDKIRDRVKNQYRTALGTELHEYVAQQIVLNHKVTNLRSVVSGIENYIYTKYKIADETNSLSFGNRLLQHVGALPKEVFETARLYINDGIAFRMTVEQPIVYSDYVFGTADTISFRDNLLRISDYKSGDHPASMDQLITYAALFCLEYTVKPRDIKTELRLYQAGEITLEEPETEDLEDTMATIINVTKVAERYKAKEG
jgi:hypothetical protein